MGNAMLRKGLLAVPLVVALAPVIAIEPAPASGRDAIFANRFENFTLAIDNLLAWCSVSVDGGVATANPPPTQFPSGTVVPQFGQPVSSTFMRGYWRFTDVPGHDASQNTTVTISAPGQIKTGHKGPSFHLVGAAGFEPTTPCPPGRCATRLRYAPIGSPQF